MLNPPNGVQLKLRIAELFAENTVRCVDANKISHD